MLPPEVVQSLPEELRSSSVVEKYNDIPSVIKAHRELESKMGNALWLPPENGEVKQEDVAKWRSEHLPKLAKRGFIELPPESPDKYQFEAPQVEGYTMDEKTTQAFRALAHNQGLTTKQANALLAFDAERFKGAMAANAPVESEEAQRLFEAEFKDKAQEAWSTARAAVEAVNGTLIPGFKDWLEGAKIADNGKIYAAGDHPRMIAMLSQLGQMLSEDHAGNFGKGAYAANPEAASEARDIMSNPNNAKHQLYAKGDKATVAYVTELLKKADPGAVNL